jgi:hypothetical protein
MIGPGTVVLSLQNGWGNGPIIGRIVGFERLLVGVSYHSATVLGPGHVLHAGTGNTFIGELDGTSSDRLATVAKAFDAAGIPATPTTSVLKEIWSKLALNAVTLPTSASIRLSADRLLATGEMEQLMKALQIRFFGVAAYELITGQGQHILLDPFLDENPGSPIKSRNLDRVDLIIVNACDRHSQWRKRSEGDQDAWCERDRREPGPIRRHAARPNCQPDLPPGMG